ncbi:hypothetical protein N185_14860 [Sinorhizobium sp. GW3]|nr:hypothetical protein N185_14860 [Sinorhizobium sp. GW3]
MSRKAPEGWTTTSLGEISEHLSRGEAPKYADEQTGVWAMGQRSVREEGIDLSYLRPHSAVKAVKDQSILKPRDICINSTGTGTLGRVGLWQKEQTGVVFADTHVTILRTKSSVALPRFVFEWLRSPVAQEAIFTECVTGSTNQIELSRSALRELSLNLPPLHEQRRIAEILSSVDDAIAATRAVIEQTRKVKQGVLERLLTKGVGHTRFNQTEIGEIPEGWSVAKIDEIGEVMVGRQRSPAFTAGEEFPYLRVANVFDNFIDTSDVLSMNFTDAEVKRYLLKAGDILLNEGQSLHLVGRNARYDGDPVACCFQNTLIRFRATELTNPDFAFALMQFLYGKGRFSEIATQTTSVAHLGSKRFASLLVPVPPLEEQREIGMVHNNLLETEAFQKSQLDQLISTKSALVSDLLTGRRRVTEALPIAAE